MTENHVMMERVPELEAQLASTPEVRQQIDVMHALARELPLEEIDRALTLTRAAYELSCTDEFTGIPYMKGLADNAYNRGLFAFRRGDYREALEQLLAALPLFEEAAFPEGEANALSLLSAIYLRLGDLAEALSYQLRGLRVSETMGDDRLLSRALNSLAIIYSRRGDYRQAVATFRRTLGLAQAMGDALAQATAHNNLCVDCRQLGDYDLALNHGQMALQLSQRAGRKNAQVVALHSLAEVHMDLGQDDQALAYLQEALALNPGSKRKHSQMALLLDIGRITRRQGKADEAVPILQEALALAQAMEARADELACHQALSTAFEHRGDYRQALLHNREAMRLQAEDFNRESEDRRKRLEVLYRTEMAQSEAALYREKTAALEREIAERERVEMALVAANEALAASNAELDAFDRTVAHALKNPLGGMLGLGELILEALDEGRLEEVRALLRQHQHTNRQVIDLINDLLLLSRVRQETVTLTAVDLGRALEKAVERLSPQIQESGARLTFPETWPTARAHMPWVVEMWANYLSNGVRYGGQPPQLTVGAERHPGGMIRCWVRDEGPGISPALQSQLFVEFGRLPSSHRDGHGLGLSIVRRIAEKLGGRAGVESEPGHGSTFYFDLPAA